MADAFDTAGSEIENQRRAAVAAIAANGSAGAQAIADAGSQIGALRGQALNAALATAARRGVPTAAQTELSGIIGRPFDMLSAANTQTGSSNAARQAALASASDNYFRQMNAAVPVARTALKAKVDYANAQRADEARRSASGGGSDSLSDSELRVRLKGAGEDFKLDALGKQRGIRDLGRAKRDQLRATVKDLEQKIAVDRFKNTAPSKVGSKNVHVVTKPSPERKMLKAALEATQKELEGTKQGIRSAKKGIGATKLAPNELFAREAGMSAGLDPDQVRGLLPIPAAKASTVKPQARIRALSDAAKAARVSPKALARITRPGGDEGSWYERAAAQAEAAIKDGIPFDTFKKDMALHMPKKLKRTQALIIAQYGPAFQR